MIEHRGPSTEFDRTAIHESGHCIVRLELQLPWSRVWARSDGSGLVEVGPCRGRPSGPARQLVATVAGMAAEALHEDTDTPAVSACLVGRDLQDPGNLPGDALHALRFAGELVDRRDPCASRARRGRLMLAGILSAEIRARAILRARWSDLLRLAWEIRARSPRPVSYAEAVRLVGG